VTKPDRLLAVGPPSSPAWKEPIAVRILVLRLQRVKLIAFDLRAFSLPSFIAL
jgi:hypothetical protein